MENSNSVELNATIFNETQIDTVVNKKADSDNFAMKDHKFDILSLNPKNLSDENLVRYFVLFLVGFFSFLNYDNWGFRPSTYDKYSFDWYGKV